PGTIPEFSTLNLPAQVARFADVLRGFVLVVGPTGAGKTTTLACLIDIINSRRAAHIVTIEDPVEYRHRHRRGLVEQIEVGNDSATFSEALRHVLRQDPDVILVGEMRDLEAISIALTAAETGHLVFSTMHTNDTTQAIDRILDVFPASQQNQVRQQLALSLTGVVAQHLIPTMDGKGRVPAVEVLVATDAIRNLIRTSRTHQIYSTLSTGRASGMQTLEESLATLCRRKRISRDDAFARSPHRDELESLLQ
ncbi:MAG TPA: type IV pilus twitching motility protein PilT, partial [Candidatus Polarisedimenticolia bacterium]|nr:type IV pilus twitching motility protein PilT [Candidatus Polarisedimenticolia bacterium]